MSLMSEIDRIESNINDFYYSAAMNGADISSLNSDGLAYSMDSSKNQLFDFMMHRVTEINDINGDVTILSGMSNTLMRLYGFLGNQKELTSINMPALKKISNAHYLLSGDVNLKEINIPRLESTENTVFSGNLSSIQKIDFPSLTNWPLGSNRLSNEMSSLEYVSTPNVSAVTTFPFGYPKLSVIDFSDRTLNSIPTLNITSTTVNQMMEATFWENLNLSILVPESLYENWRIATNWLFFQAVPQSLSVDKQYIFPVPDKTIEIGKKDGTTVRLSATQLDSTCGQYSCPKIQNAFGIIPYQTAFLNDPDGAIRSLSVNYPSYGGNYELNNLSAINAPNLTEIVYNNAMGSMNPFGFDYRKLKSISVDNDELYSEDNIVYDRTDKNRCAFVFGNTIENAETKFKNITYFGPRRYNLDFPETETVKTFNRTIPVFTNTTLCCESKHLVFDNLIGVDSSQLFSNIATTPDLSVEFPNLLYINKRPSDEDQNEDAIYLYSGSLINVIGPIFNSCGISYVSVPNLITIPIWFIHSKGNPDKVNYGVKVIDFSKRKSDTLPNIRSSNVSIYSYFNGCNNNFEIWVPARLYDKWYADPKWSFVKDRLVAK